MPPWSFLSARGRSPRRGRASPTPSSAASTERTPSSALVEFLFGWKQTEKPAGLRPWAADAVLVSSRLVGVDSHLLEFRLLSDPRTQRANKPLPPLLLPGQHLMLAPLAALAAAEAASDVPVGECRPYTPIDVSDAKVTLLVKRSGAFSQWLVQLAIGQSVQLRGPFGAVALDLGLSSTSSSGYRCPSLYLSRVGIALPVRRLALVAGGSGVTPVAQMLNAACARLASHSATAAGEAAGAATLLEITVLVSDHTPEHALLTAELDALHVQYPKLIVALHRTFTALPRGQTSPGASGARRVDEAMLRERLPAPSDDTVVLVCGPAGFEASVQRDLSTIGHVHTVNLSSGDVRSPAVSQVLLTAHRLLTPWASALRCFVPHMDSGRSSDSGKAGLGEVRDLTVKELATPVAASRKPLLQEGTEFQQTELLC